MQPRDTPSDDQPGSLTLEPIGIVRCRHASKLEAPRQPVAAGGHDGIIELFPGRNFEHALEDIAGWERLWVIFWFHRNAGWRPKVLPPRSVSGRKGVFATRAPHRPNPLGLSAVRLERVAGLTLFVRDLDMLDGTPVLDIKPYVAYSDAFPAAASGWLEPPRDPGPSYAVDFAPPSEAQLAWLEAHGAAPLRARIASVLALGPQPHPYRRIRLEGGGTLRLAVQDWRVRFRVAGQQVCVLEIHSGYRAAQLAAGTPDPAGALALHREYLRWQATTPAVRSTAMR
ncbi:MAG: tRNA (N6-threonylcarbamoyladenosine(37)-N6)-methyltransferase TrmO [Gammaproteobacteria bacterium]|nr:tRNA (N6-threonylcarbamoyladenosine(37)-N6)-methyltransferase TrmO [Gammaproteobacteria bacterium]